MEAECGVLGGLHRSIAGAQRQAQRGQRVAGDEASILAAQDDTDVVTRGCPM
jgi:hypothetical protein